MTAEDYAILKLLNEVMEARNAEAFVALWRCFADWQGLDAGLRRESCRR